MSKLNNSDIEVQEKIDKENKEFKIIENNKANNNNLNVLKENLKKKDTEEDTGKSILLKNMSKRI